MAKQLQKPFSTVGRNESALGRWDVVVSEASRFACPSEQTGTVRLLLPAVFGLILPPGCGLKPEIVRLPFLEENDSGRAGTNNSLELVRLVLGELYRKLMNMKYLFCLIGIVLITGCTSSPDPTAVSTIPAPTPTPENYGLYTNSDLQIYADSIDLKIQQALKNNNTSQAQELGRKRQELIAEFNRRGLKRSPAAPSGHPHYAQTVKHSGNGLPGEN